MTMELKHLAPYLPYGLKVAIYDSEKVYMKEAMNIKGTRIITLNCSWLSVLEKGNNTENEITLFPTEVSMDHYADNKLIKPLLRPLSDLTKEIEHNSKPFTPYYDWHNHQDQINALVKLSKYKYGSFMEYNGLTYDAQLYNLLIEYHFDVFGLIEKSEAIPKT